MKSDSQVIFKINDDDVEEEDEKRKAYFEGLIAQFDNPKVIKKSFELHHENDDDDPIFFVHEENEEEEDEDDLQNQFFEQKPNSNN